jgi:hypothetical protein
LQGLGQSPETKKVADSGAAVGEMGWAVIVSPLFSLAAIGAKRKAHKRETPLSGRCPAPRQAPF